MKLDSYLTEYTKINLKWIIDINVRAKSIAILEESIRVNLYDFALGSYFLDKIPKATKEKIVKLY